ncbi:MAG: hypothetical protein RIR00_1704 [Pseudomonadota bacterium]|jgi:CBS domain-containing membrane protein
MTTKVQLATVKTHVVELVRLLSDQSMHHIPVVDEKRKRVGIVTQSDIIAALYRQIVLSSASTIAKPSSDTPEPS